MIKIGQGTTDHEQYFLPLRRFFLLFTVFLSTLFIYSTVLFALGGVPDEAGTAENRSKPEIARDRGNLASSGALEASSEQPVWAVDASIRLRYEYQDGFNARYYGSHPDRGDRYDGFLLERLRLSTVYHPKSRLKVSLGLQDSNVWDSAFRDSDFYSGSFQRVNSPYRDKFELHDTFIELKDLASFSVKIGRQSISFGNNRIFGPGQWGNTGSWIWDAAKISYIFKRGFVDLYYGRTVLHDPEVFSLRHGHGFESIGFYSHLTFTTPSMTLNFEPFAMTKTNNRHTYTAESGTLGPLHSYYYGLRCLFQGPGNLTFDGTGVMQRGTLADDEILAYGYHIKIGYELSVFSIPAFSLEYTYASGDKDPADNRHGTFDGAFGSRDRILGRINLFKWQNVEDLQFNAAFKPRKHWSIETEFHYLNLADAHDGWSLNSKLYRDQTGSSGRNVGSEFDLIAGFTLTPHHRFMAGYSHFEPGEFTESIVSNQSADWCFVQWFLEVFPLRTGAVKGTGNK